MASEPNALTPRPISPKTVTMATQPRSTGDVLASARPPAVANAFTGAGYPGAGSAVNAARRESTTARAQVAAVRRGTTIKSISRDPDAQGSADKNRAMRYRRI